MVRKALGEIGDRFDAVGVGGGDQGHVQVADLGAVLSLVVEGAGQIADRDDEHLLDDVAVERDSGHLAELRQAIPLVDDEGEGLPQRRVRLHELAPEPLSMVADSRGYSVNTASDPEIPSPVRNRR